MRPIGGVFREVVDFHALRSAARRAARGAGQNRQAAAFLCELEANVLALQRELVAGDYRPGPFTTFQIIDPKPRTISAAPFRDRVVHHALCAAMEPAFERYAIHDSYACRPGRGNLAAVRRVQRLSRRHAAYAKLDVLHCFETVELDVLMGRIERRFRERRLLDLCEVVLRAGAGPDGRGLPIGNLTSQHFANFLLGALDHHALEHLHVGAWVRYMDDIVLFAADTAAARASADGAAAFLRGALHLEEKRTARRIAPVHVGIPFLGFRIWPGRARLDRARRGRLQRRLRAIERAQRAGALGEREAQQRAGAFIAWAEQGDTLGLRRATLRS